MQALFDHTVNKMDVLVITRDLANYKYCTIEQELVSICNN